MELKRVILMSIRPEWVAKILNGDKTVEIRKFIGNIKEGDIVYAYCTKGKPNLFQDKDNYGEYAHALSFLYEPMNGKVVARFAVGKINKLEIYDDGCSFIKNGEQCGKDELTKGSCLTIDQLCEYIGYGDDNSIGNNTAIGYSLEITHLEIFDKPRELGEYKVRRFISKKGALEWYEPITHAPQSWQRAWIDE